MTYRIPTELLINITNYLTPEEQITGMLICKDWQPIFRYGLYHDISIKGLPQLELLFKSLIASSNNPAVDIPSGYLVKRLFIQQQTTISLQKMIQERLIIPRFLFEQLPDLCPNMEVLDFDPETWKFLCFHNNVSKWHYMRQLPTLASLGASLPFLKHMGHGLTALSIQSSMIVDISTQGRLVSILSLAPNIQSLTIRGDGEENVKSTLSLALEDMETIHRLLPYLESLNISGKNIVLSISSDEKVLDRIDALPTAPHITTLCLQTRHTSPTWLYYVAHKYPQLRELAMDVHYENRELLVVADNSNRVENFQVEKALFLTLAQKCRHLELIELSCPILDHWFNAALFEILRGHQCIRQIKPSCQKNNQIKFNSELNLAMQEAKHLVTALEIEQWRLDTKLPHTLHILRNFTQLAYLELKCDSYRDEYDLGTLTESCPQLETLVLEWGCLVADSSTTTKWRRSVPLQTLTMTFVSFTTDVFDRLSEFCPRLSTLSLTKCKQICNINDTASQTVININMPRHQLKCLVLDGVRLDYSSASMFYHGLSSYIRIAYLKTKRNQLWHHHIGYKNNNRTHPLLASLDRTDTGIVKSYFDNRECSRKLGTRNSNNSNSGAEFLEALSELKVGDALKTNMMFGYIRVNCKSIDHFYLDGNVSSNNNNN